MGFNGPPPPLSGSTIKKKDFGVSFLSITTVFIFQNTKVRYFILKMQIYESSKSSK